MGGQKKVSSLRDTGPQPNGAPTGLILKQKAAEVIPVVTKWVRIAEGPINFEEELEHTSVLLEEV